jgi:hypothetical protein
MPALRGKEIMAKEDWITIGLEWVGTDGRRSGIILDEEFMEASQAGVRDDKGNLRFTRYEVNSDKDNAPTFSLVVRREKENS